MKIADKKSKRKLTLTLTEEETKHLFAMAMYFPIEGEQRTDEHRQFLDELENHLIANNIADYDRSKYIKKSRIY